MREKCYWRRLVVLQENDHEVAESFLARLKGRTLFVSEDAPSYPWRRIRPGDYRRVLGSEWNNVVVDLRWPIPANAFPATFETIKAGGKAVVILPKESLAEVYRKRGGTGLFGKYLEEALKLYKEEGKCPPWKPPSGLTREQRSALKKLDGFIIGRNRVLSIIGDRGRGKSALLGAMAAKLVTIHGVRRVEVTSPNPEMNSFLKMLTKTLREQKEYFRLEKGDGSWKVFGRDWRIEWVEPPKAGGRTGVVLVDEAAALGFTRLRRIIERSWKAIISTTVHGYEGSGRYLVHALLSKLNIYNVIELKEPVRYPPGDPLEKWLYEAFQLKVEFKEDTSPLELRKLNKEELASPSRFKEIVGLLALSHYRWEPSDIEVILEHPRANVFVYDGTKAPIAVAVSVDEEPVEDPWETTRGNVLTRLLNRVKRIEARRVMRIAVLPKFQRRGYGSRLLRFVEEDAEGRAVGAVFSNHEVLDFWLKNEYVVIYLSPKYNKITGEKNVAVAKGEGVEDVAKDFVKTLLSIAHISYRDVDTITLTKMLKSPPLQGLEIEIDEKYLQLFIEGKIEAELASRSLYPCILKYPQLIRDLEQPSLCVGFLLQGRTIWDLAVSHSMELSETKEKLYENLRALAKLCLRKEVEVSGSKSA